MEELVAAFRGGSARLSISADELENARQWARGQLEPWARQQREDRLARWWTAEMEHKWMRVKFRGISAANLESACVLLEQAGISIAKDEGQKAGFEVGQRRGSANRTTVLCHESKTPPIQGEKLRVLCCIGLSLLIVSMGAVNWQVPTDIEFSDALNLYIPAFFSGFFWT